MSLDRSLKSKASLTRHRNVLSRAERMGALQDAEKWTDGRSVFGLPKVAHRKASVGKKAAKKEEAAAPGAAPGAADAKAAAPAADAKGAKPAADAKAAKGADKKK
ncbi:MAG: small basic protein [Phycisphaerae bacterium]